MDAALKKILKPVTLALRHLLEGEYAAEGKWHPGDLEQRLAAIGVRRDRAPVPVDELAHLPVEDRQARKIVDAYLKLREEAGVERSEAVAEFIRETAYTWANRLIALRCMEARELIDSVILQQDTYGGRSLEHHRLAQRQPELCAGEDDGLFAVLDKVFHEQIKRLPMLFDPQAPGIALRPSAAAIKDCFGLLSLKADSLRKYRIRIAEHENAAADAELQNPFVAPDALGWTYQYWNTEEKDRVFEMVRTVKNAKIAGADIVPATQLYTEDYMVKFLVQNSLGATWMGIHPDSKLPTGGTEQTALAAVDGKQHAASEITEASANGSGWDYYVRDAERAPVEKKPVREITFLDPACGSGHFLIEAFDLFFAMYQAEGELTEPAEICTAILTQNLFGIDIDVRAVQIAEAALWMKAAERVFDYDGAATNLVAATASHLKGPAWEEFLAGFAKEPSVARVLRKFAQTMEHIDEIGSLARPVEDLRAIIQEEHATWEQQQREQRQQGNILFKEMREDAVRGHLPFLEISDGEFGDELFYRAKAGIDVFTQQARESGAFDDQMLASETRAGFRLVDLLSRQYDAVAANPPYMGSKNMGTHLKSHVERHFSAGKRDLYAAFMIKSCDLVIQGGRVAMIAPHTWMFLGSYADLRLRDNERSNTGKCGILVDTTIETIGQLGRHAFDEVDPPSNVALTVWACVAPKSGHRLTAFRVIASMPAEEQAMLLRSHDSDNSLAVSYRPEQSRFTQIPEAPLVYWLSSSVHSLLANPPFRFVDVVTTRYGMNTGNNGRFVRFFWEQKCGGLRWVPYAKAGGYSKWAGMEWFLLEWFKDGSRIHHTQRAKVQNAQFYFSEGATYSLMARGGLGARHLPAEVAFDSASLSMFPLSRDKTSIYEILAVANCRVTSYLLRVLASDIKFNPGYVDRSAFVFPKNERTTRLVENAIQCKRWEVATVPTERTFARLNYEIPSATEAVRHTLEGAIEKDMFLEFGLSGSDEETIIGETGTPSGWFPLISGYTAAPSLSAELQEIECTVREIVDSHDHRMLDEIALAALHTRLHGLFSAGRGGMIELDGEDSDPADKEDDAEPAVGTRLPIPAESFVEEIAQKLEVHPISVYWMIKEGIEKHGWRCPSEEQRQFADRISVYVLDLLNHRWPKQIESRKLVPNWADPDGIIPLTPQANETTLFERVQQRLSADAIDTNDFANVMGKPLDSWLATEFFSHHTKQFKKRPIAWQVQSGSFTARSTPAIACLLYYHKLDSDLLRKVRKLAEDLRKTRETELRGILSVAPEARSDRQENRRVELDDVVVELQRFDATLETVATTGFGPDSLRPTLRQYAHNDALLALKARWLRRLSELVATGPLRDWLKAASQTDLHPDFGSWIANAMSHLDHFCARVEPQPPEQQTLAIDPTAADLAKLIAAEAPTMLINSLRLACDVWWKPFKEAVLQPLKDQVKELKDEQKQCEARLKADPEPEPPDVRELKARVKELKADIKQLNTTVAEKSGLAQAMREKIECWRSKEPQTWGDWLSEQPLFDQISSMDHRRPAPTTIAEFIVQESLYAPDINDGVRVNIAPLQKAGLLAADVLAPKELDKAIADRAEWRADERRWVREGKLPQPGWWPEAAEGGKQP